MSLNTCQLVDSVVLLTSASNSTMQTAHCHRFMFRRIGAYVLPMTLSPLRSVLIMKMASPTLPIHQGNAKSSPSQSVPPLGWTEENSPIYDEYPSVNKIQVRVMIYIPTSVKFSLV